MLSTLSVQLSTYLPTEGGIKAVFCWNIFYASPGSSIHLYFPRRHNIRDIFTIRHNKGTSHFTGTIINRFRFTFKCQKTELTRTPRESLIKCLYLYSLALAITHNTRRNSRYEKFMNPHPSLRSLFVGDTIKGHNETMSMIEGVFSQGRLPRCLFVLGSASRDC